MVVIVVGPAAVGGRWYAVHLFTLGVLTNLVLGFSRHFAVTLAMRLDGDVAPPPLVLANLGSVLVLAGLPSRRELVLATGATLLTIAVVRNYVTLRRTRRTALACRFPFVIRGYERAHGQFLHGALLGALLGTGVLPGGWYGPARLAHLHVNVLGWGGLTLLSTLVFFGPTVLRVRIEDGAIARAARGLRHGATGLTVGVLALLLTGIGGTAASVLRVLAGLGIAVLAWGAAEVVVPLVRAHRRSRAPGLSGALVTAAAVWLLAGLVLDAVVVATGSWRFLDELGAAVLLGAVGPAMLGTAIYLAPVLADRTRRVATRDGVETAGPLRAGVWQLGVVAVVVGGLVGGATGATVTRAGWSVLLASLAVVLLTLARARRA